MHENITILLGAIRAVGEALAGFADGYALQEEMHSEPDNGNTQSGALPAAGKKKATSKKKVASKKKTTAKSASVASMDDVRDAMSTIMQEHPTGETVVTEILAQVDASKLSEIDEENYDEVVRLCNEAIESAGDAPTSPADALFN